MPVKSQAQARWAHANADAPGRLGEVAREFVKETHGMKVRKLPERKRAKKKKAPERERVFGSLAPE